VSIACSGFVSRYADIFLSLSLNIINLATAVTVTDRICRSYKFEAHAEGLLVVRRSEISVKLERLFAKNGECLQHLSFCFW